MELKDYPRPTNDTGIGFHDTAQVACRPADPAAYARYLHDDLGVRWYKVLAGGSNKPDLVAAFTAAGIECPVRLYAYRPHPHHVVRESDVRAYVQAGAHYIEWGNEANLLCEWDEASWREGAIADKLCEQWLRNADVIRRAGGIPLFVAMSPGGNYQHRQLLTTMMDWLRLHNHLDSLQGAAIAIHNRPLNHPLDYVDRGGEPVPGCHFLDYEWIDDLVRSYVGHSLPLLATEAGYELGWRQDDRYPEITPDLHAQGNLAIVDGFRTGRWRQSLFCQCFWLVDHFGDPGHSFDNAHWHNNRAYGRNLPAVAALRADWQTRPFVRHVQPPQPPAGIDPRIVWKPSPNFGYPRGTKGRNSQAIVTFVEHIMDGSLAAGDSWILNPASQVSYHFGVGKAGQIHQYVREEDAAWHAGKVAGCTWPLYKAGVNPNLMTIGIALEGKSGEPLTAAQYDALLWLHGYLLDRHPIAVTPDTIIGHYRIDSINRAYCPGSAFPWVRLFGEIRREGLPEDETATDPATLVEKARYWLEEMQRAIEADRVQRANDIRLSLIKLLYRAEAVLKES